jgi:biopolymer transport protein ExbD
MTVAWKVRHEGSPKAVEGLSAQQVLEGLNDGLWEPTDEVMGPGDTSWVPVEAHPVFAEAAAEIEPPPPRHYDDETHLDMNALIDVCLVLLIFFILTTSYAALQSRLESPDLDNTKPGIPVVSKEEVEHSMIYATVKMEGDKPVVRVEGKAVDPARLTAELLKYKTSKGTAILLLEAEPKVPHGAVVAVQDAAKGAGMKRVLRLVSTGGG